jgi:CDP-diacylglycerol--serine O-phosphatidyltransferase
VGLPIPAAGCTLATLIYFAEYLPEGLARRLPMAVLILMYALSFLMVSRVRYTSFKDYDWFKAHPFSSMVTAILLFALVASEPKLLGFPVLFGYVLFGVLYTFLVLARRGNAACEAEEDVRPAA